MSPGVQPAAASGSTKTGNLLAQGAVLSVPNKETSEVVAEGRHKPIETNIT